MNFSQNKSQFDQFFGALKNQTHSTSENWTDTVQKKYYTQYIDVIPEHFHAYIQALDELNRAFQDAEEKIKNLYD